MGLYSTTPVTPTITAAALVAGLALMTTDGTHFSTTFQINSTAPTGLYYVHFIQGNGTGTIPGDGAYAAPLSFLHAPIAVLHTSGAPDVLACDDGPGGAKVTGGLWIILSTTQFTKTAATYLLADSATS